MEDLEKISTIFEDAECIYITHGRLTAPKDYSKKREEQDLEADTYIRRKIEQLYMDKGLFYKEIPYGNLGTITKERTGGGLNKRAIFFAPLFSTLSVFPN